ncbi:hypothetical protein [Streptomyces longisporoflavus]|uniref:hypothetical protein n=1 Tax=Streptomyces longisporoflavus TaxID=28044 RepID=UPI00167CF3E1
MPSNSTWLWPHGGFSRPGTRPRRCAGTGWPVGSPRPPYDRIIVTASLRAIPDAWRRQARDGTVILAPFATPYAPGGLLKLTVGKGAASGRFVGPAFYMPVRSHRQGRRLSPPSDHTKSVGCSSPRGKVAVQAVRS